MAGEDGGVTDGVDCGDDGGVDEETRRPVLLRSSGFVLRFSGSSVTIKIKKISCFKTTLQIWIYVFIIQRILFHNIRLNYIL